MTKPIGYYTSYTFGEGGLLTDMQEEWGSRFEALNDQDRLWMISKLAEQILAYEPNDGELSPLVELAMERAKSELEVGDRLGLIEALVHQVKNSPR